ARFISINGTITTDVGISRTLDIKISELERIKSNLPLNTGSEDPIYQRKSYIASTESGNMEVNSFVDVTTYFNILRNRSGCSNLELGMIRNFTLDYFRRNVSKLNEIEYGI